MNIFEMFDRKEIDSFLLSSGALGTFKYVEEISDNFYTNWYEAKSKFLFKYFKDDLIISRNVCIEKDLDIIKVEVEQFLNSLRSFNLRNTIRNTFSEEELSKNEVKKDITIISNTGKTVKLQKESKVSRAFKHFITDDDGYLKEVQTKYSRIFNNKSLKGTINISIHPLDYLTVSSNNSNWTSCLEVFGGCYRGGIGALMDSSYMVVVYFTTNNNDKTCHLFKDLYWNDKKWRTLATISEEGFIHMNRQYPFTSNGLLEEAYSLIEDSFFPNQKFSETTLYDTSLNLIKINSGLLYNDIAARKTFIKFREGLDTTSLSRVSGAKLATCPVCGSRKDELSNFLECSLCAPIETCVDCGERFSYDNDEFSIYIDGHGSVCSNCADNYAYCDSCCEYHYHEDVISIEHSGHWNECLCISCARNSNHIGFCECCESAYKIEDLHYFSSEQESTGDFETDTTDFNDVELLCEYCLKRFASK